MVVRLRELRRILPPVFWTVWLGTLVNRAGAFVAPILTFYLTTRRHLSLGEAGAIVAALGAGNVIAALTGGVLADRIGRRATMIISLFGGAVGLVALSAARDPWVIGAVAFGFGCVGDLYRPAVSAFVADVVPAPHRMRAYGILYWATNLGFAIAPVVGGVIATVSYRALFVGDAGTMAIYGVIVCLRVPETHPARSAATRSSVTLASIARDREYVRFWLSTVLVGFLFYQLNTTLSGWMEIQGHGPSAYGAILAINGVMIVLFQPALTERLATVPRRDILSYAALVTGIGFALHGASRSILVHGLAVVVWSLGEIAESPAGSAFVADRAPPDARGRYQGTFSMAFGLAACTAPIVGPRLLAIDPRLVWGGCAVVGALAALGYRGLGPRA